MVAYYLQNTKKILVLVFGALLMSCAATRLNTPTIKSTYVEMADYFRMEYFFSSDTIKRNEIVYITITWTNVSDSSLYLTPEANLVMDVYSPLEDEPYDGFFNKGFRNAYLIDDVSNSKNVILIFPGEKYERTLQIPPNVLKNQLTFFTGSHSYRLYHAVRIDALKHGTIRSGPKYITILD